MKAKVSTMLLLPLFQQLFNISYAKKVEQTSNQGLGWQKKFILSFHFWISLDPKLKRMFRTKVWAGFFKHAKKKKKEEGKKERKQKILWGTLGIAVRHSYHGYSRVHPLYVWMWVCKDETEFEKEMRRKNKIKIERERKKQWEREREFGACCHTSAVSIKKNLSFSVFARSCCSFLLSLWPLLFRWKNQ